MELTWGERQIDNVGNGRSKGRSTYFQKPGGDSEAECDQLNLAHETETKNDDESEGGDCDEVICTGWGEPGEEWTKWGCATVVLSVFTQ